MTNFGRFALLTCAYCVSRGYWLVDHAPVVEKHRNSTARSAAESLELPRCCATTGSRLKFAPLPAMGTSALPVACEVPACAGVSQKEATRHLWIKATGDPQVARYFEYASTFSTTAEIAERGQAYSERQQTIPQLIRLAALRHSVDPARALALAWRESRYTDAVRRERNGARSCGPLQVHERFTPGICEASLARKVDAGISHLARLIRQHAGDAERVYRGGTRAIREGM